MLSLTELLAVLPKDHEKYGEIKTFFLELAEGFLSNVDDEGNIYGVCRGSGYSFRLDYYKHDLACVTNDTHGTGIVLIALLEVEKNRNL